MRISWSYKVLAGYLVFVVGITLMVLLASQQKVDLVTPDYYARELKYQQRIDEAARTRTLAEPVRYSIEKEKLIIYFPAEFSGQEITGELLLYCPADESKDIRHTIQTRENTVTVTVPARLKGIFEIQLGWSAKGLKYYFEQQIFL